MIVDALAALAELAAPLRCGGCGAPDDSLCEACVRSIALAATGGADPVELDTPSTAGLEVWSLTSYGGVVANLIKVHKDDGRHDLAGVLGALLRLGVSSACEQWALSTPSLAPIVAVPVPSSTSSVRRRGRKPLHEITRVALSGTDIEVIDGLRPVRAVRDQAGLGAGERSANLRGALRARGDGWAARAVLVVDDVVTTGATLGEAARALREAGAEQVAAVTIAATERRDGTREREPKIR